MEKKIKSAFCLLLFFLCVIGAKSYAAYRPENDTTPHSTQEQAIKFIDSCPRPEASPFWPNVNPENFWNNVKANIYNRLKLYAGSNTDFCGYAAMSYLFLKDNPLGYVKLMLELYKKGEAGYHGIRIIPSAAVRERAGLLSFKGKLDIHPADQMWFLSLADHFKGYLNILYPHYRPGYENKLWAGVNYTKFNRMVRNLLGYKVNANGSDLLRPWWIGNLYEYLKKALENNREVVVFLNNTYLNHKTHSSLKPRIPTHYIILLGIEKSEDTELIKFKYWDYGGITLRELTPEFLRKITYAISKCNFKQDKKKDEKK